MHLIKAVRFYLSALTLLLSTHATLAYETSGCALFFPETLSAPCLKAYLEHRFYTSVNDEPLKNAFGINGGVFADAGVRWIFWNRLQTAFSYEFMRRNVVMGLGYSYPFFNDLMWASVSINVYNYGFDARTTATFSHASLSAGPFFDRIVPAVTVAYDGDERVTGLGIGVNSAISSAVDAFGEYFPILQRTAANAQKVNTFSFGIILKTFHHHFSFFLSNSNDVGMLTNMKGANDNNLHLGFKIERLFDL